jgi:hypothetical protein
MGCKFSWFYSVPASKCTKVKLSRYRQAGDKGESKYISYSFLKSALDGSGQLHVPASFYPQRKDSQYTLYRRLGGPQSWTGHRG